MPVAHGRIQFAGVELARFRGDTEEWKAQHEALHNGCWVWEDLAAKGVFLFERIMDLDSDLRLEALNDKLDTECAWSAQLLKLLAGWLETSTSVLAEVERVEKAYGRCEGADSLRRSISEAKGILTPDDQFFTGDALSDLQDDAINQHRAGDTEELLNL